MRRDDARELAVLGTCLAGALSAGATGDSAATSAGAAALLTLAVALFRTRLAPWINAIDLRWAAPVVALSAAAAGFVQDGVWSAIQLALLAILVVTRAAPPRAVADRAALLAGTLLVVLGASTTDSPLLGLAVALLAVCSPLAALLANLPYGTQRRVAVRHLAMVSGIVLIASVGLFLLFPRLGGGLGPPSPDPASATTGFSSTVRLGDIDQLRDDPTIVLILRADPTTPAPTHVRGRTFDTFDGQTWSATIPPESVRGTGTPVTRWEVTATADAGSVAFAPGLLTAVAPGFVASPGAWRLGGPPRAYRTTLSVVDVEAAQDEEPVASWTAVPPGVPVKALADLAAGTTAGERATSVVSALSNFAYTRVPQEAGVEAPVDAFLQRQSGHCEHFATTAALALRTRGVPARVVTGYAGPEPITPGAWFFRRSHAHAWVEYRDESGRWWTLDPTPGGPPAAGLPQPLNLGESLVLAWREGVLGYDQQTQGAWVARAGRWAQRRLTGIEPGEGTPWVGVWVVAGAGVLLAFLARRLVKSLAQRLAGEASPLPEGRVARAHALARRAVQRAGIQVPSSLPPVDAAKWISDRAPETGLALEQLAWLHYRVRYGGEGDASVAADARRLAREVDRAIRRETAHRADAMDQHG
jgi:transglutaminase-like putative cysteine protease